jgi:hypothetical protein
LRGRPVGDVAVIGMASFMCPKSVDVFGELSRNLTGTILKKGLRAPYWQGR